MPYSTLIIFVAYDVLPAASLNTNFGNSDFLKTQVDTNLIQGRLTLETGVPVSTTDQTAKTTLYFAPFRGNRIGLKSGSSWDLYSFTEVSLSLSGYIKGVVYDIFGYLSGGSLVLESLAWKKVTASNSPTAGASKTINISDTGDLAVGMEVTIKDGSNSEVTNITAVVVNTSITVDNLANGYTTPDVYGFNTRATGLTLDDGKWIKSGDATRRYIGTIRITTSTGQCEDSEARRNVWNFANRIKRTLKGVDGANSWTYTNNAWRPANGSSVYGTGRVGVVVGLAEEILSVQVLTMSNNASYVRMSGGIGINATTVNSAKTYGGVTGGGIPVSHRCDYLGILGIGAYYIQRLEFCDQTGTTTWYGDDGSSAIQTGLTGFMDM